MNLNTFSEVTGFLLNGVKPSNISFYKAAASVTQRTDELKRLQARLLYKASSDAFLDKHAGHYVCKFLQTQPDGEWYPEIDGLLEKAASCIGPKIFDFLLENIDETELRKSASLGKLLSLGGAAAAKIPQSLVAALLLLSATAGGAKWMIDRDIGVGSEKEQMLRARIDEYVDNQLYEENKAKNKLTYVS